MGEFRKILVALKFVENPDDILSLSVNLAKTYSAKMYVIHVVPDMPRLSFYSNAYELWEEFRNQAVKETLKQMTRYIKSFPGNFGDIEPIIEVGDAAEKIVDDIERLLGMVPSTAGAV